MEDDPTRHDGTAQRATPENPSDEWLGRIIDGRYLILERLGEGGMGAVFVAEHTSLRKRVALKVIHAHFVGNDEIAARFAREAMTSAHIEHPNVASALDFGSLPEGGAYLVMQLVRGPSLSEHIARNGALSCRETCEIAAQIADAVAAAHASGIVHRDLKPDNVVLMPNEDGPPTVKVLDFGIAHVKAQSAAPSAVSKGLTRQGVVIGTPGYMPPEQATGQIVDERADLYALGVILWELLTGTMPFEGSTFSEIVTRQLSGPAPELVLSTQTAVPDELRRLVRALLERSPAARPSSATEVRDTLRGLFSQPLANGSHRVVSGSPRARNEALPTYRGAAPQTLPKSWRFPMAALMLVIVLGVLRWATAGDDKASNVPAQSAQEAPAKTASSRPDKSAPAPKRPRAEDDGSQADTAASEEAPTPPKRATSRRTRSRSKSDRPRAGERIRRALDDLLQ